MYDYRKEPSIHSSKIRGFYQKHRDKFSKFVYNQPKEVLCKLWRDLNAWQWDEEILGPFKGRLAADTLMAVIDDRVGHYEILRYVNVVYAKQMTEDEYFKWTVKRCFDEIERSKNPLYR